MTKILGTKTLDFTSGDGSKVKGTQLFVSFPEDGVVGAMVDKLFIRDGIELPPLTPGMSVDIVYNRHGKPTAVRVVR